MKCKALFLLLIMAVVFSPGCSTTSLTTERTVSEENVFVSTANPKLDLRISQDFGYSGKTEESERIQEYTTTVKHESYLFGEIENNIYTKGASVRIASLPSKLRWHGQVFPFDRSVTVDSGSTKMSGSTYQYIVMAPATVFNDQETELIDDKGYRSTSCYLLKVWARGSTHVRVYINYFERLSSCQAWAPRALTAEQQEILDGFTARSAKNLIFQ